MTVHDHRYAQLFSDRRLSVEDNKQLRIAIGSALIGTAIEYYDFFIFLTASAVVFPTLFFPSLSPTMGLIASYSTLVVTFLARPIGAVFFGHIGDKLGRKKSLVPSLIITALSTFLIGVLPTYGTVGVWAPIMVVVLRFIQGFAVGGEWGGATAILVEFAPPGRRGLFGAICPLGNVIGVFSSTLIYALIPKDLLMDWAWRIPFLFSIFLLLVGLYIRLNLQETPLFREMKLKGTVEAKVPFFEVLRTGKRAILLTIGTRVGESVFGWMIVGFLMSYATRTVGITQNTVLYTILSASALAMFTWPMAGALSDRIGRRRVFLGGAILGVVCAFPFFWLVDTGSVVAFFFAVVFGYAIINGAVYAIQPAFFSEMFPTNIRYTGVSLGYQVANFMGGITPIVATILVAMADGKSWGISLYLICALLVSICSVSAIRDRAKADISKEDVLFAPS